MDKLAASYERCRELHRRHGRTYYLATRFLPVWKRRHVHALYGFARYADEIVDRLDGTTPAEREAALGAWAAAFTAGLAGDAVDDPILPAVLHTIEVFGLNRADFALFLRSMAMDLTITGYASYADLLDYMEGSAAVIGAMMLPVLGVGSAGVGRVGIGDRAAAMESARELGRAFQLTNFIRDVAEDLHRGRIYLPQADLDAYGVTHADLDRAARTGAASQPIRDLIAFEVERARRHYRAAAPGITMLERSSQVCIGAAYALYQGILDEIAASDHDVFGRRAVVPRRRQIALAVACVARPWAARLSLRRH